MADEKLKRRIRKMMFYYKPKKTSHSVYGGTYYTTDIYKSVKNELKKVGTTKWNTASYRGEESEVYNELKKLGLIPKKIAKTKKEKGNENYYSWQDKENFGLHIKPI